MIKKSQTIVFLISLLYFAFALPQSAYAEESNNSAGAIVTVNGLAEVLRGGSKSTVKPGDSIFVHDVINVAKDGSVKVLLKDRSILDIGAGSQFSVDKYVPGNGSDREVDLAIAHGTLRSAVTQKVEGAGKFRVKTNNATMGVRGTDFIVQADTKTQVTVLQGSVEVAPGTGSGDGSSRGSQHSTGKSLMLKPGQQVVASSGAPLPEKANTLDAGALRNLSNTSRVADNTYSRAITIVVAANSNSTGTQQAQNGQGSGRSPASSGNSSAGGSGENGASGGASGEGNVANNGATGGEGSGAPGNGSGAGGGANGGGASTAPTTTAAVGFGGTTLSDIGTTVSTGIAIPPPINTTQIGISGTFSPVTPAAPVTVNSGGTSVVTIVVTQK
jgi:FecR protein